MRTPHVVSGLAVLLLAGLSAPGYATESTPGQSAFVAELAHDALLSANSQTSSVADRQKRLEGLLDEDFDVPLIASFVLGRYWQNASDSERRKFTAVYRDFMVRAYAQRFTEYNGESFRITGQRDESATSTVVSTEISPIISEPPVKVDWRVVGKGGYRIIDIIVGGISMVLAQREEFASSLQRNGGDLASLIREMEVKLSAQQ